MKQDKHQPDNVYNEHFYDFVDRSSFASANVVVPLVMDLLAPTSVCDVGCGRGIWAKTFEVAGVERVRGVDGTYVQKSDLKIPINCFTYADLSKSFTLERGFDLAVCLEVAEHLPRSISNHLVQELTQCAKVVLFSAAIPGQGGTAHINEQWHDYWHQKFKARGFDCYDILRHQIFANPEVSWWYKQNIFLYAPTETAHEFGLTKIVNPNQNQLIPISPVILNRYIYVGGLLRMLRHEVIRSFFNLFSR